VRSTVLPESFDAAASSSATAAAGAAAGGDEAAVVCHSIGSFSSSTASSIADEGEEGQDAAGPGRGLANGSEQRHANGTSGGASRSADVAQPASATPGGSLTADALAAHTAAAASRTQQAPAASKQPPAANNVASSSLAAAVGGCASAATLSSSAADGAGHRSSRGITVEKRLWSPSSSTVSEGLHVRHAVGCVVVLPPSSLLKLLLL
jgi:hypothetical protein